MTTPSACAHCGLSTSTNCAGCKRMACSAACQRALGCKGSGCRARPRENLEQSALLALPDELLLMVLRRVPRGDAARLASQRLRLLWDEAHAPAPGSDERPCRAVVDSWRAAADVLTQLQRRSTAAYCRRLVITLKRKNTWRYKPASLHPVEEFFSDPDLRKSHNDTLRAARMRPDAARAFMARLPDFAEALAAVRVDVNDGDEYAADMAMLAAAVPFRDISCASYTQKAIVLIIESLRSPTAAAHATLRSLDFTHAFGFSDFLQTTGEPVKAEAVATATALANLSSAPRLARITLSHTNISASAAATLAPLARAPALREFIIENHIGVDDAMAAALVPLARSATLEVLEVTGTKRGSGTNSGITALATALAQPGAAPLRVLDFNSTGIGSTGAAALARITTLQKLMLHANAIDDVGAAAFALHPRLRVLNLGWNSITDIGALALLRAPPPALRELSLRGVVGVIDRAVQHVAQLRARGVNVHM